MVKTENSMKRQCHKQENRIEGLSLAGGMRGSGKAALVYKNH